MSNYRDGVQISGCYGLDGDRGRDGYDYRQHNGHLCGDGTVLHIDCSGGYMNPCSHVKKWHITIHTHCTNVSFLVLIFYFS